MAETRTDAGFVFLYSLWLKSRHVREAREAGKIPLFLSSNLWWGALPIGHYNKLIPLSSTPSCLYSSRFQHPVLSKPNHSSKFSSESLLPWSLFWLPLYTWSPPDWSRLFYSLGLEQLEVIANILFLLVSFLCLQDRNTCSRHSRT